jgi:histidinol dehydrogenase
MKILKASEVNMKDFHQRRVKLEKTKEKVHEIVDLVKSKGDAALIELTAKFDKVELKSLQVTQKEIDEAMTRVPEPVREALKVCIDNIKRFHMTLYEASPEFRGEGIELGRMFVPLDSVGIYVPGGKANYPSTVIMASIPAKTAGVKTIIVCTPPDKDGKVSDVVLAAAQMCGINQIFKVGGAQAIAAMAYGTQTVPHVQKIIGPGSMFVVAAKELVRNDVGVDFMAGPSEIVIIADETADPVFVAADMLAQAEHDEDALVVTITDRESLAKKIQEEVLKQIEQVPKKAIASKSLEKNGHIIISKDLDEAINISNEIAPEHLSLNVRSPRKLLEKVRNAGSVFLGDFSAVAAGDYCTGPNHILPTGGGARVISGLSVDDFIKKIYYQNVSKEELRKLSKTVITMARVEGLDAHALSIERRLEKVHTPDKTNGKPKPK